MILLPFHDRHTVLLNHVGIRMTLFDDYIAPRIEFWKCNISHSYYCTAPRLNQCPIRIMFPNTCSIFPYSFRNRVFQMILLLLVSTLIAHSSQQELSTNLSQPVNYRGNASSVRFFSFFFKISPNLIPSLGWKWRKKYGTTRELSRECLFCELSLMKSFIVVIDI